jgi:hypothetical protein
VSLPRAIDEHLVPRVSVRAAAKYLGCSTRWVQKEITAGRLPAIDLSQPGARRACWGVPVHELRALVLRAEMAAERRVREALGAADRKKEANRANEAAPTPKEAALTQSLARAHR